MQNRTIAASIALCCLVLAVSFAGGANAANPFMPKITNKDKVRLDDTKTPFRSETLYSTALDSLGRTINSKITYKKIIQPKTIGNTAGGNELPFNLTNMVINSISELSGPRLIVVPYDPDYIINDFQTGGRGSRVLPDLIIGGSITEFDKDIEVKAGSIDVDLLLGGGESEADFGFGAGRSYKLSRVVLDLHLLDYNTHAVIPGVTVSNTVLVLEIEKDRDFGFAIYGSGLGINGRIKHSQGFHRAVRNLVEYSILQLFGKYYDVPYWRLIGMKDPDPDVMQSISKSFKQKSRAKQIAEIQALLGKFNLGTYVDPATGRKIQRPPVDGVLDPVTMAYINAFVDKYAPEIEGQSLSTLYATLVSKSTFGIAQPVQQVNAVADASVEKNFNKLNTQAVWLFGDVRRNR